MGWLEINQIEEKIKSSEMGWFKINQIEQNKKLTNKSSSVNMNEWIRIRTTTRRRRITWWGPSWRWRTWGRRGDRTWACGPVEGSRFWGVGPIPCREGKRRSCWRRTSSSPCYLLQALMKVGQMGWSALPLTTLTLRRTAFSLRFLSPLSPSLLLFFVLFP